MRLLSLDVQIWLYRRRTIWFYRYIFYITIIIAYLIPSEHGFPTCTAFIASSSTKCSVTEVIDHRRRLLQPERRNTVTGTWIPLRNERCQTMRVLSSRAEPNTDDQPSSSDEQQLIIDIDVTPNIMSKIVVDDSTVSVSQLQPQQQQVELLESLDETFDYDGRISRGNVNENRCGYACIIGAPNMGKSTLLNAILQEDLCICTSRPQTTRHAILGILSTNHTQVCFIDTPGIIEAPAYKLQEGMMEAVTSAFRDADVLLVVTDLFSTPIPNDTLFAKVQRSAKPIIVVINKIDLTAQAANVKQPPAKIARDNTESGDSMMDMETPIRKTVSVEEAVALWRRLIPNALLIVPASAQNGPNDAGVTLIRRLFCGGPNVRGAIRNIGRPIPGMFASSEMTINDPLWHDETIRSYLLPLSPPLYDTDVITDRTERFVASEIIRSVLFTTFQKELPYCCEVRITEYKEPKETMLSDNKGKKMDRMIRISADIVVERDSQKAIVIGTNGQQVRQVGTMSREKLQDFLQHPVFLTLNVKVNKDWRKKEDQLKLYGYLS